MKHVPASLACALLLFVAPSLASAQRASLGPTLRPLQGISPFTPGNLLVSHGGSLREYTRAGVLCQALEVPHPDTTRYSGSGGETAAGETGLLHALDSGSPRWRVHVRDPSIFAVLATHGLRAASGSRLDQRGVAVLPSGELFAADWNGRIYHFDPAGNLVGDVPTGAFNLLNIDLARDGTLVLGSRFGDVVVTDTSLTSVHRFSVGGGLVTVAFVPEPLEEVGFESEDDHLTLLTNGQDVSGAEEFGRLLRVDGWSSNGPSAAIFDSSPGGPNAGGQDRDLLVDRGNLLILQGRPGQSVPGVFDVLGRRRTYHVPGGWTEDVQADGPPGYRTLDLAPLADQPGFLATATATQEAGFCADAVRRVEIHVSGSGAIDGFVFFP